MSPTLRVPAALRRYGGGADEIAVEGPCVRAALEDLFARHPRLRERVVDRRGALHSHLLLFRNGEELPRSGCMDARLEESDRLELVAAVEGG